MGAIPRNFELHVHSFTNICLEPKQNEHTRKSSSTMDVSQGQPSSSALRILATAQAFRIYTLGTSSYLALQSLPLLLTPKLIVSLLASEARAITDLETYLCRALALVLLTLSASVVLLSGHVPLSTQLSTPIAKAQEENGDGNIKDPYVDTAVGRHIKSLQVSQ